MHPMKMDDLKLIELVKQNKHLYDKNHCAYHDMAKKSLTWKAISVALGSSVENCRKRFRCLRDRFTKEKRSHQRTKEAMLEDPSLPIVYKKMIFLWDHLLHRGSCDGGSEIETGEANFPEINKGDEVEKEVLILNGLVETELTTDETNDVEIQEVIIYDELGNVAEIYPQDDTHAVGAYIETKMDSESDDAGSAGKNPVAQMDSELNPSNGHDGGSAERDVDVKMDFHVSPANEHSNENDAAGSPEKVPEETSACKQKNSDVPEVNCEFQITPEMSVVTQQQSQAFHAYTESITNSENIPQSKRRRNRTNAIFNRTNNQHQKTRDSTVLPLTPLPKFVNTAKVTKTSKAANVAFCTVIKSYLDRINRPDRLSAARLQILKILHDELYSSHK